MKQAVVIIHGIGEQKPMDTLRRFVDSILPASSSSNQPKFRSKPDRLSESFELRKLSAPSTSSRPVTDFYEYYWAYQMRGTKFQHVQQWFIQLFFRSPKNVPKRILPIWVISWLIFLLAVYFLVHGLYPISSSFSVISQHNLRNALFSFLVLPLFNLVMLRYIGDAARYLNPSPENIAQRHKIRSNGIALLRKLHESHLYDRIIVVGHSLGSIIGYDIIRHLWVDWNTYHGSPEDFHQEALKELQKAGINLGLNHSEAQIDDFQEKQRNLWREQRSLGNPWLITDFITLGSPLAHAQLLLANSRTELLERQRERELPVCPPDDEDKTYSYLSHPYTVGDKTRTIRLLHDGAPFACTRWTNMYFSGDIIAGALNGIFGAGIKDVCVYKKKFRILSYLPFTHTCYWQKNEASVAELRKAIGLNSKELFAKKKEKNEGLLPSGS